MLFDSITGPISQKYCLLFYIFSIVQFFGFIFLVLAILYVIFLGKTKVEISDIISLGFIASLQLMSYIQLRLLYNMCINSIR